MGNVAGGVWWRALSICTTSGGAVRFVLTTFVHARRTSGFRKSGSLTAPSMPVIVGTLCRAAVSAVPHLPRGPWRSENLADLNRFRSGPATGVVKEVSSVAGVLPLEDVNLLPGRTTLLRSEDADAADTGMGDPARRRRDVSWRSRSRGVTAISRSRILRGRE